MFVPSSKDYLRENRVTRPTSIKKTKIPTASKTIKHSCSQCPRDDATKYSISEKEVRWLCPECVERFKRRDVKETPNFLKASRLSH